jgi:hypothetical protein
LKDVKVPTFIAVAWKEAVKIFNKIKVEFTAKKTVLPEAKRTVLPELLTAIYIEKIILLLELEQVIPDQIIDVGDDSDLVTAVEALDITTSSSKCLDYIEGISRDNHLFVLDNISLPQLRGQMQLSYSMAGARVEGLKLLRSLLAVFTSDTYYGAKCILLCHYPLSSNNIHLPVAANGSMNLSGSHYMFRCPRSRLSELEGSFNSLYSYLVEELGNCITISNGADSAMLVILSTLGVKIGEQDHALLSRVNIFKHLEDILENAVLMSTEQVEQGEKPTQYSVVTKAAMKLFILMALQVAVVDPSSDSSQDRLEVLPSIRRAKSGPATLSSSVFDTLYTQISRIVKIIDSKISPFPHCVDTYYTCITADVVTILSEATLLLQAISKDKLCQLLLVKPPWVLLLLKLLFIGPIECQPSILRILSDLLVMDNLNILGFDSMKEELVMLLQHKIHSNTAVGTSYTACSGAELVVTLLLKLCAKPHLDNCGLFLYHVEHDGSGGLDSSWMRDNQDYFDKYFAGEAMIPVASEAVSLLRLLLSKAKWQVTATQVLHAVISSSTNDNTDDTVSAELIGALCVYGAHCDKPYAHSPCLISNNYDNSYSLGLVVANGVDTVLVSEQATPSQAAVSEQDNEGEVTHLEPVNLPCYEIKAINRFPIENLGSYISEGIVKAVLLLASNASSNPQVQGKRKLLVCLTIKVVASLLTMPTTARIICQQLLHDPTLSLFSQVLDLAQSEPVSGDIKDTAMLEDYILMCVQHKSRLQFKLSLAPTSNDEVKVDVVPPAETTKATENTEINRSNGITRHDYDDERDGDNEHDEHEGGDYEEHDHEDDDVDMLVSQLQEMGFPRDLSRYVLMLVDFDLNEAANSLFTDQDNLEMQFHEHQMRHEQSAVHREPPAPSRPSFEAHPSLVYAPEDAVCLPLYASPSLTSERIAALVPGETIKILAVVKTDSGDWNKVSLMDHLKPRLDEPDDSVVDNTRNEYAYALSRRNGRDVFLPAGSAYNGVTVPPSSSESVALNCKYRVLFSGALVREKCDLTSPEVTELPSNTSIEAVEECVSSDGKIRLRLVTPVAGWITKHPRIVCKLTDVEDKTGLALLLDAVTNELDVLAGKETDLCKRDSRYFGSLQGQHRHKQVSTTSKSQLLQNQMMRVLGASSRGAAIKNIAKKYADISDVSSTIEARNKSLLKMYARATAIRILLLLCAQQPHTAVITSLMSLLPTKNEVSDDSSVHETKKETTKLINLLQLVSFRGSPLSQAGTELLSVNIFDYYSSARPMNSIHTDYVLGQLLIELYVSGYNIATRNTAHEEFLTALLSGLVDSIAHNVRLICRPEAAEANMLDVHYEEDNDEQILRNGSVHYALWATRIISIIASKVAWIELFHPTRATLVRIWSCVLYAASMSLKQLACNILADLLSYITLTELMEACLEYIPVKRLRRFTERRMLQEMGDHPIYSRFLQALLHLLSEIKLCQQRCNIKRETTIESGDKGRDVLSFHSSNSLGKDATPYVQILPSLYSDGRWETRHIADSWTLEALVYCNKISPHSEPLLDAKEVVVLENIPQHASKEEVSEWCGIVCDVYKSVATKLTKSSIYVPQDPTAPFYCYIKFTDEVNARKALAVDVSMLSCTNSKLLDEASSDVKEVYKRTIQRPPAMQVTPSYLLSTDSGFVKLRAGGKAYDLHDQIDAVMQNPLLTTVSDQAFCVSFGKKASEEKYFDYSLPSEQWVHLALVYHYSSASSVSLYINGELKDTIECQFSLPLSVIGSRGQYSLDGLLADLRVWNYARSAGEIMRDMHVDWSVSDIKGLFCYLKCDQTTGSVRDLALVNLYDSTSTLSVKVVSCEYRSDDTCPPLRPIAADIEPFIVGAVEAPASLLDEEADLGSEILEFTGMLHKPALYGLSGAAAEASHEVVSLHYRVISCNDDIEHVTGYIEWCERGGIRSLLRGTITNKTEVVFTVPREHACVLGGPENLAWLQHLAFRGSINCNGDLKGTFIVDVSAEISPLEAGQVALDVVSIARSYSITTSNSDTLISRSPAYSLDPGLVTVRSNPKMRHERSLLSSNVTRIASSPRENHTEEKEEGERCEEKTDDELDSLVYDPVFGICEGEGSVWVEFEVVEIGRAHV